MSRKKLTLLNILYTNFSRSRTETAKYLVKLYACRKGSGIPVDGKDHRCFEILLAGFFINGMGKYTRNLIWKKVDLMLKRMYIILRSWIVLGITIFWTGFFSGIFGTCTECAGAQKHHFWSNRYNEINALRIKSVNMTCNQNIFQINGCH